MGRDMTASPRLAIVGSGEIAGFHVDAARAAGFLVEHVAARLDSKTVHKFADRYSIQTAWTDPFEMLDASDKWDVVILAASTEAMIGLLEFARAKGKPILAEKPVGLDSESLDAIAGDDNVIVGFNRRFYAPVQAAKRFVEDGGPCLFHLELPESVPFNGRSVVDGESREPDLRAVVLNSVHGFDLVNYLGGTFVVESVHHVLPIEERRGGILLLRSIRGDICSVSANWNAPANFALTIDRDGERFELRPLEIGVLYRGMEVIEPTATTSIRRYVPRQIQQFPPDQASLDFKPGFVAQCEAFRGLLTGIRSPIAASLRDAQSALVCAEALINRR